MFGKKSEKKRKRDEAANAFDHASGSAALDAVVDMHVPDTFTGVPRGRDAQMHPDERSPYSLPKSESA